MLPWQISLIYLFDRSCRFVLTITACVCSEKNDPNKDKLTTDKRLCKNYLSAFKGGIRKSASKENGVIICVIENKSLPLRNNMTLKSFVHFSDADWVTWILGSAILQNHYKNKFISYFLCE